jgi:catechol 2,3-dioxygenase-like lactoylglutathione lyase family enzyme
MPRLERIIESALYVDDVERARAFYGDVLELKTIMETEPLTAYDVGGQSVLLIFKRDSTTKTMVLPGGEGNSSGEIPPHNGAGPLHLCFAINADQLPQWEQTLAKHNVVIEGRTHWVRGGQSIYFRDPDGHLLELMTPGNWTIY